MLEVFVKDALALPVIVIPMKAMLDNSGGTFAMVGHRRKLIGIAPILSADDHVHMQAWLKCRSIASILMDGVIEQQVLSGSYSLVIEVTCVRVHHLCHKGMGRIQPLLSGITHESSFFV